MQPRISHARSLDGYRLRLEFTDGASGELDFQDRVTGRGGIVGELASLDLFKQVSVDPEAGTVVWPNGVDFAPTSSTAS